MYVCVPVCIHNVCVAGTELMHALLNSLALSWYASVFNTGYTETGTPCLYQSLEYKLHDSEITVLSGNHKGPSGPPRRNEIFFIIIK